ncbi:MAG: hypothetical protein DRP66_07705 [Planctomycetota bacterium]|nr:MAG: hypothetical protein DRP66_07705 [Planctomycetota bacterium]
MSGIEGEVSGGGICSWSSQLTIKNCVIANNMCLGRRGNIIYSDSLGGGGLFCFNSDLVIINSTIAGNSTEGDGGGICCMSSNLTVNNSIIWGNEATLGPAVVLGIHYRYGMRYEPSTCAVSYCDVQGGQAGIVVGPDNTLNWQMGNIDADPYFVGYEPWEPIEGMISHWKLDEESGATAYDSFGGNDGALYGGGEWRPAGGKIGGALDINGTDTYISITGYKGVTGSTPRTCAAWIKMPTPGVAGVIMHWGMGPPAGSRWTFAVDSLGRLRLELGGGAIVGSTVIANGTWRHVAAVSDGTDLAGVLLYVDGNPETLAPPNTNPAINTLPGADVIISSFGAPFEGLIDDVHLYDRALSEEEIRRIYKYGFFDYHLQPGSPCIDAGTAGTDAGVYEDIEGNIRPWDYPGVDNNGDEPEFDMGAYEFVNIAPIADAGDGQTVYLCEEDTAEVELDGSGSMDADDDELEYFWFIGDEQIAEGVNPTVELGAGEYLIELIVYDGIEESEPDEVVVTVVGPVEADVHIVPRVINRNSRGRKVTAIITLPEGIGKNDIDGEFTLYPGEIKAGPQIVRENNGIVKVFALFDKGALVAAVSSNGPVELTVVGRLTTGECVSGRDSVRITQPQRRRVWRRRQ